jgi:Zn finger protein HypA/HybF involved in hydrogenase expression/predicted DNA-binding protein
MKPEIRDEIAKVVAEVLPEQKATIEKIVEDYLSKKQTEPKPEPMEEQTLPSELEDKLPLYNSYIDKNKPDKKILFRLNLDLYEKLKQRAKEREISESSFIRESIMHRTIRSSMEDSTKLEALFDECSVWTHGKGMILQLGGEQGFINQVKKRKITSTLWTPKYLDKLASVILDLEETRARFDDLLDALNLNREQSQFFAVSFRERAKHVPIVVEEQSQIMPYAICQNCNRLLSKEDFISTVCKYCGHNKAIIFNYENVSDEARVIPYAQCANEECRRPFSRQQRKNWNMCPFCGSIESTIIKYDEIFWSGQKHETKTVEKEVTALEEKLEDKIESPR